MATQPMAAERPILRFDRDAETSPRRLAILIGMGAVLVIGTFWAFSGGDQEPAVAPAPPAAVAPPAPPVVAPLPPAASASALTSGLQLHGVMGSGADAAAIIAVNGEQLLVRVGREILPGLPLHAVAADHVIVLERGVPTRIGFPDAPTDAAADPGRAPDPRRAITPAQ